MGGLQSEVNTPNLICLFCFISGRHIFFQHQLGNRREAAGEKEVSYTTHEAVSSSLDRLLKARMMECLVLGEVYTHNH